MFHFCPEIYNLKGVIYTKLNMFEEALVNLNKAV